MKDTMENRIQFLVENNALKAFFDNCEKQGKSAITYIDTSVIYGVNFIKAAFPWKRTDEGRLFWGPLADKYNDLTNDEGLKITDSDIATIEALHDLLIDNHGYSTEFKPLKNARELTDKMHRILRKDQ